MVRAPAQWLWPAIIVIGILCSHLPLFGAELSPKEEAAIIEEEDKAEAELPMEKLPPGSLHGRLHLEKEPAGDPNTVVGQFIADKRVYQLRLEDPKLWVRLRKVNGKSVTLLGKIRMRGKYFIAHAVEIPAPGIRRTDRSRRSGM